MKPKTVDLLLDCYIKERIPDADAILEELNDVGVPKERSHTFCYAPTPLHYAEEYAKDVPLSKGRSHTFSFSPTPVFRADLCTDGFSNQALSVEESVSSADVTDGLTIEEKEKYIAIARKLAKAADEFQARMNSSHVKSEKRVSDEHGKGYTPEERNTVETIYSGGPSQSVSIIASTLTSCFTPQTLQAAVRYLSGQTDDVSQQMAITLEISTHVFKVMGRRMWSTISSVVAETFQDYAELEDL